VLQLGLSPSHLSFRFLQIMQAKRFGFGTLEFPPPNISWTGLVPLWASMGESDIMMVSGGVPEVDDMAVAGMD
jgi:hypothetical protein